MSSACKNSTPNDEPPSFAVELRHLYQRKNPTKMLE
jgi:hypothetical protein